MKIPRRYSHYLFGIIQSGLTCLIASAIASAPLLSEGNFLSHWLASWLIAWATMLPVVILAAPAIRRMVASMTVEKLPVVLQQRDR